MAAIIGALRVVIGADTGSFEDGMKKASSGLKAFANNATTIAAGIELQKIFEKAGEAIGDMVKAVFKSIDAMDHLSKEAQKIGTSVEALSGLVLAATLSDVSVEQLSKSMAKLTKGMVDSDKETSAVKRALDALGISAGAFKKLSPEKQLEVLADEFKRTEDGATKGAIAMALFGERVGRQMIPLLNTGATGFKEMREQAEKLNLIVGTHTAKSAEHFNDNLKLLHASTQGFFNVLASLLLPKLEDLSNTLVKLVLDANGFRDSAEKLGRMILFVWDNAGQFAKVIEFIGNLLLPFKASFDALTKVLAFFVAKMLEGADPKLKESYNKLLQDLGFNTSAFTKEVKDLTGETKKLDEELKKKREILSEQEAAKLKKVNDQIFGLNVATRESMGLFTQFPAGFVQMASSLDLFKKDLDTIPKSFDALKPKAQELFVAMRFSEQQKAILELLPPWETYIAKVNALDEALKKSAISAEEHKLKSMNAAAAMEQAYITAAAGIAGAFGEMFTAIGGQNKEWARAAKVAAAAQALISTLAGSAKALEQGGIFGFAWAAAVIAKGLTLVAAIKGTSLSGMAAGGSFVVPGGISGTDNKMVPLNLASGERVTVETPEQQRRSGSEITIRGIRPRDFVTGEMLRELVDGLSAGHIDGYKIKFA